MRLCPADLEELKGQLAGLRQGGGRVAGVDLGALDRVLDHQPQDMTMTVEAGITVERLQARAAQAGQWLPIDPPHPERCSVGALIGGNFSGSRRCGYGTIREHLIGLGVVLADGRLIRSGGRVVKNVAGYDLQKLFVGSRGSLGVIVEATFKLLPLPESEQLVQARCGSLVEAGALIEQLVEARMAPVIFDLHLSTLTATGPAPTLVVGFAGTREHVDHQIDRARQLGVASALEVEPQRQFWAEPAPARMRSVLPAHTVATLSEMRDATWLAHIGNGVIHYRGGTAPPREVLPWPLLRRIKAAFDPTGLFPEPPGGETA